MEILDVGRIYARIQKSKALVVQSREQSQASQNLLTRSSFGLGMHRSSIALCRIQCGLTKRWPDLQNSSPQE
jgi:hypothetical protein